MTTSAALAERYFGSLDAPKGKHLVWFDDSGHWPQLEEPEKFCAVLTEKLLESHD